MIFPEFGKLTKYQYRIN